MSRNVRFDAAVCSKFFFGPKETVYIFIYHVHKYEAMSQYTSGIDLVFLGGGILAADIQANPLDLITNVDSE